MRRNVADIEKKELELRRERAAADMTVGCLQRCSPHLYAEKPLLLERRVEGASSRLPAELLSLFPLHTRSAPDSLLLLNCVATLQYFLL